MIKIGLARRYFRISRIFFHLTMLLWLAETIFFSFKYGAHWYATMPDEILFDTIVSRGLVVTLIFFLFSLKVLLEGVLNSFENYDTLSITDKKD